MARQDTGRTGKAGQRAGRTGIVHEQDGRVIKRAGHKKLDANSSGLSPGLDARTMNGSAQSEIILSGHLDYKCYSLRYSYPDTWTINGTV